MPVGYFPKFTVRRPTWLKQPTVQEICSVSTCISDGPDNWSDPWLHNTLWLFDSPDLAWRVVPEGDRNRCDLYAYFMYPVQFREGRRHEFTIPPLNITPLPSTFERLGFDAVSRSVDSAFECSPLSCNHMAESMDVNRHCLANDLDTVLYMASVFESGDCEPGPYHVVEVWRQRIG